MNDVIVCKKLNFKDGEFVEIPLYRSIIYCFSGKVEVKYNGGSVELSANSFLFLKENDEYFIEETETAEVYYLGVLTPSFSNSYLKPILDGDGNPVGFCVKEAFKYCEKEKSDVILNALGNLIASYASVFCGKEGIDGVLEEIKEVIKRNVANSAFKIDDYLKTLPITPDYAKKRFTKKTGLSPKAYLIKLRLDKAKTLLSGTDRFDYSIKAVAKSCGYSDPLYFSRVFRKKFKFSPSEYAHRFDKPIKNKKVPLGGVGEVDI